MSEQETIRNRRQSIDETSEAGSDRFSGMPCHRFTIRHGLNPPLSIELPASELEFLRGRSLAEAIEYLLGRENPLIASAARETLDDPAALVEAGESETSARPVDPNDRVDSLLEQDETYLGMSRAQRGG